MQPRRSLSLVPIRAAGKPSATRAGSSEILADLFVGPLGAVRLGRVFWGTDVGRTAVLRRLEGTPAAVAAAVERASRVAHPRVVKVLGLVEADNASYVASEYVAGVSLGELHRRAMELGTPVNPRVALRIVRDALLAVTAARQAFDEQQLGPPPRLLFSDTAWVAEFGDTLLMEVGVAGALAARTLGADSVASFLGSTSESSDGDASSEVFAAGVLLWQLFANRTLLEGPESGVRARVVDAEIPRLDAVPQQRKLPGAVTGLVDRALKPDRRERFAGPERMALAMGSLPVEWIATDGEVQDEISRLMPEVLDERRRLSHHADPTDEPGLCVWDAPTRSARRPGGLATLRSSAWVDDEALGERRLEEKRTVRPPGAPAASLPPPDISLPVERPAAIRVSFAPHQRRGRRWLVALGLAAVAGACLLVLAYRALVRAPAAELTKDRAIAAQGAPAPASPPASQPAQRAPEAANSKPALAAARSQASAARGNDGAASAPSAPASQSSATPKAAPRKGAFRPRSIDPYRPKGI
jgi:hypothetical protein